jgi:hypothetical protein
MEIAGMEFMSQTWEAIWQLKRSLSLFGVFEIALEFIP